MDKLPNRIRELRKARGWSLEKLAGLADTGVSYLSELERGERELRLTWMKRIAAALECQEADLLLVEQNSDALSADERRLIEAYRSTDSRGRDQMLRFAEINLPYRAESDAA